MQTQNTITAADLALSARKTRLQELENEIKANYQAFVHTGFALREIKDDRLYEEDGFQTWDSYLKERVSEVFGIEKRQVQRLVACAEIRPKLNRATRETHDSKWSTRSLLEVGRLAPEKKLPTGGVAKDYGAINKVDAQWVENRAEELADGGSVTSTHVRKAVDEKLGVKPKPAKPKTTDRIELDDYILRVRGTLQGMLHNLQKVPADARASLIEDCGRNCSEIKQLCTTLLGWFDEAPESCHTYGNSDDVNSFTSCNHTDPASWVPRDGASHCPACGKWMGRLEGSE